MSRVRSTLAWTVKSPVPLLLLSVAINFGLAQRVRTLNAVIDSVKAERRLSIGQTVAELSAVDSTGKIVRIDYRSTTVPTLIYVLRPTCGWCVRNEANMKALAAQSSGKYRMVYLSTEEAGIDAYRQKHELGSSLYVASPQTMKAYKLGGTPQTLLISADGVLLEDWTGAYTDELKAAIESRMAVHLPGVTAAPSTVPAGIPSK